MANERTFKFLPFTKKIAIVKIKGHSKCKDPRKSNPWKNSKKKKKKKTAWEWGTGNVAQFVECLPSMSEGLSSIPRQ
jgi:hypothetical protein